MAGDLESVEAAADEDDDEEDDDEEDEEEDEDDDDAGEGEVWIGMLVLLLRVALLSGLFASFEVFAAFADFVSFDALGAASCTGGGLLLPFGFWLGISDGLSGRLTIRPVQSKTLYTAVDPRPYPHGSILHDSIVKQCYVEML